MEIPRPFAIAIDDLGWMNGTNQGYQGKGPYRVGLKRNMDINDYTAVIALAQKVGVRLQGLFILGELDREDLVQSIPTISSKGAYWKKGDPELQLEVMNIVKSNSSHLEFGLHGVGHEYWPTDSDYFKRAEWYNLEDKVPWPEKSIRTHIDCFVNIMAQYGITAENGHSFPESFVPCAYSYYWNPKPTKDQYSLGAVLNEYGTKYANTDFAIIPERNPPIDGGFDQGVHVMNRFNYGNLWHMVGQLPMIPIKYQSTDFIETHWPNLLAQDNFLQESVTDSWVKYYKEVNQHNNRYYSKNTAQHHSQFLYKKYTKISQKGNIITLDNSKMPIDKNHTNTAQNLVLKIQISKDQHLTDILLDGSQIPAYYEEENYAYLFLPKLTSGTQTLQYQIGTNMPTNIVWHDNTCNIYSIIDQVETIRLRGCFYGKQSITFLTDQPITQVMTEDSKLSMLSWTQESNKIIIEISAHDIQGVTGEIILIKRSES